MFRIKWSYLSLFESANPGNTIAAISQNIFFIQSLYNNMRELLMIMQIVWSGVQDDIMSNVVVRARARSQVWDSGNIIVLPS